MSTQKKQSNIVNILINIVLPFLILTKFSRESILGPTLGLVVALSFPLGYGLLQYYQTKKINFFSAIGLVSIVLTGGIGLLKLDPKWIAFKEAGIPFIIGCAVLISQKTKYPLVKTFFKEMLDLEKIDTEYEKKGSKGRFEKLLGRSSYYLAGTFFLSSFLNFILAKSLVKSAPGTEIYNTELAKMAALSFPVIVVPTMIIVTLVLQRIFHDIKEHTHLELEEVVRR